MATTTFKSVQASTTTSLTGIYTAPAATTSMVTVLQATNTGSTSATIDLAFTDTSASTTKYAAKAIVVNPGSSIGLLAGPIVLETGDILKIYGSAATIDVVGSISETA